MGNFIGNLVNSAVGFAPFALRGIRDSEDRSLAQAAQKTAQDRQAKQDALAQALGGSTIKKNTADAAHLDAETAAMGTKSDIKGTVFDHDGNPWNEHTDGTMSRATIRGMDGAPPSAPPAPDLNAGGRAGDIDLREPQQGTQPTQATAPKFGPRPPKEPNPATIPGTKENLAAEEAKLKLGLKYRPAPEPTILQGTTAPGEAPKFFRVSKSGGPAEEIPGINVKPAAGAAQNVPSSMAAAKANIESARKIMNDYEDKLKAGSAHYGTIDATLGALSSSPAALNAKGPLGALESFGANTASSHLQSSNADLARYMTAKKYVAEAILNTHKRPNQTQYEIEQELSGIGPNPSPEQIDMARQRRDRMYEEVFNNPSGGGPPAAHAAQVHDPLLSKYGIKPTVP